MTGKFIRKSATMKKLLQKKSSKSAKTADTMDSQVTATLLMGSPDEVLPILPSDERIPDLCGTWTTCGQNVTLKRGNDVD